eukprot:TRINITY_DN41_c3_g1_i1.p1 TRINITY_DN41_c3_g1~~TRINITY_DN41_c3_g1_i1.p1  ORF type:complete len:252 (-),score=63.52 TRINITY_DN41_c3_g1_i1:355-1110(-)
MPRKKKILLVIECTSFLNWYEIFDGAVAYKDENDEEKGFEIQVEQAPFPDISAVSYDNDQCIVTIRKQQNPHKGTSQERERTVQIDFVLLRSVTRGIHQQDSRNILFSFMHANIPSVNSLLSAYMALERPIFFGGLKSIQKRLGKDKFPLIPQTFFPGHREMLILPDPCVIKIGSAHAGYGKIKLEDNSLVSDVKSIIALHGDYATAEPFVDWDFDYRVQKIGCHYRCFKRFSPNWKGKSSKFMYSIGYYY